MAQAPGSRPSSGAYYRCRGDDFFILSVHVDEQLFAYNNRQALDDFKQQLNAKFKCSGSGPAGYSLGFNIHRYRKARKLRISHEHYLQALLERFDPQGCHPISTPLPGG
jgi:hypothetical protein